LLPNIEAADFQEQNFLIESIPMMFPIQLLGVQSGLNSLLFSTIEVENDAMDGNFRKPITLNSGLRRFKSTDPVLASRISNLHTENIFSIPLSSLKSEIILGYDRSLLESMKPIYSDFVKNQNFNFRSFPFYEGFQSVVITEFENVKLTNLLMMNSDRGVTKINAREFDFNSKSLSIGSKLEVKNGKINNTIKLYYLRGDNHIDYKFNESINRITGKANLSNLNSGLELKTKLTLNQLESIIFNLGYKYDEGSSRNQSIHKYNSDQVDANYNLNNYELVFGYQRILSANTLLTISAGLNTNSSMKIGDLFCINYFQSINDVFDFNLILEYKSNYLPTNSIFYTFQNSIWDPTSVNTLYFIDISNLPVEPIKNCDVVAFVEKKLMDSWIRTSVQLKSFYRIANNLIFSNNYPLESTYYNSDFSFNQNYNSKKYGVILSISNNFPHISLTNQTSVAIMESMNINEQNGLSHLALNYNPFTISNIMSWNWGNLSVAPLLIYKLGRFIFDKNLDTYYSYSDSSIAYSVKTDLQSQKRLNPQLRFDISVNYLLFDNPIKLDIGLSLINIFNNQFESNRIYSFNENNHSIEIKSEFTNLPRFLILSLNLFYEL
jgi:hypothetical protein